MTADEEQDEGSVSFRVYWAYFRAGSGVLAMAILAMLAAAEAMSQYQQVMLCSQLPLSRLRSGHAEHSQHQGVLGSSKYWCYMASWPHLAKSHGLLQRW